MGVSPAEPLQVMLIIGTIILLSILLALSIYTRHWLGANPGAAKKKFLSVVKTFQGIWHRIRDIFRLHNLRKALMRT